MTGVVNRSPERRSAALIAGIAVAVAMVLGGGGSPAPPQELAAQIAVAALFCLWLILWPVVPRDRLRPTFALCGLITVIPVIQLVPLPPTIWQVLPGRALERQALDLIGAGHTWRPLSMSPARTLGSLLALVPPAIMLVLTGTLGQRGRNVVIGTVAGVALLTILVGALQAAGGPASPFRLYVADTGHLNGFQANHNSAADILLIGMVAYAVVAREWIERAPARRAGAIGKMIVFAGVALFSLAVFLTASRAGTALLPVAWSAVLAVNRPSWLLSSQRLPWRGLVIAALLIAVSLSLALYLLRGNEVVAAVLRRYDFGAELRPQIWTDSVQAARTYFPVGAGMGAFIPAYLAAERIDVVGMTLPNRAHNDFVELFVEAGAPGFVVLAIIIAVLGRLGWRQFRNPWASIRRQAYFAAATFTIIALHSQVDYPLRSISLACIAAASAGLLVPVARGPRGTDVQV
ncbi:MAG TPA: O-antigen ligase family protein [Novosphingobium sp.]|nr:O-antigen ligase family protein [Novosphingobium sp.]